MNTQLTQLKLGAARLNPRYVRLILVIISLILFALGAGAPEGGGGLSG